MYNEYAQHDFLLNMDDEKIFEAIRPFLVTQLENDKIAKYKPLVKELHSDSWRQAVKELALDNYRFNVLGARPFIFQVRNDEVMSGDISEGIYLAFQEEDLYERVPKDIMAAFRLMGLDPEETYWEGSV